MSASVVTTGAARIMGDAEAVAHLVPSAEALAMPVSWNGEKRYAAGVLPVADAFIAWSHTARPWFTKTTPRSYPQFVPSWWRLPLHGVSLAIALLLASGLLKKRWIRRKETRR